MAIPVDGLVLHAHGITANEAAMTGESEEVKKDTVANCMQRMSEHEATGEQSRGSHDLPSPILLSGTAI